MHTAHSVFVELPGFFSDLLDKLDWSPKINLQLLRQYILHSCINLNF